MPETSFMLMNLLFFWKIMFYVWVKDDFDIFYEKNTKIIILGHKNLYGFSFITNNA